VHLTDLEICRHFDIMNNADRHPFWGQQQVVMALPLNPLHPTKTSVTLHPSAYLYATNDRNKTMVGLQEWYC